MKSLPILTVLLLLLAACAQAPADNDMMVYTIGAIGPLTGETASIGLPMQQVANFAVAEINEQWALENKRLELIWEDGGCTGKDALSAAQKLVNIDGVAVIFGGMCSGETLGIAPFTEENNVLLFSSVSSSPDITDAGDFVFRNYPSDAGQMERAVAFIQEQGYGRVALLSSNTEYSQAQRNVYLVLLGDQIVADELMDANSRDVRAQVTKIAAATPDVVILMPQDPNAAGIFAKQFFESGLDAAFIGNDIVTQEQTIGEYSTELEGHYGVRPLDVSGEGYERMVAATGCDIGYYCATMYDGTYLLAEMLDQCNGDAVCMKDALNALENWEGPYTGATTFDENGDVTGGFVMFRAENGEWVPIE